MALLRIFAALVGYVVMFFYVLGLTGFGNFVLLFSAS